VSNVTGGIKVAIDATAGKNDSVTIDLGSQSVDRVMTNLGDGDKRLDGEKRHGERQHAIHRRCGHDSLTLAAGATVAKSLTARMDDGDNTLEVDGTVSRDLVMTAGAGDDTLTIGNRRHHQPQCHCALGRRRQHGVDRRRCGATGDDHRGEWGDDTIDITSDATIGRSVVTALGSGDNKLSVEGTTDGSLVYSGRDGNDDVTIDESAAITGNLVAQLGSGDNAVNVKGSVGNNLVVTSSNSADTVTVADGATVGGQTIEHLGNSLHHRFGFEFGFGGHGDRASLNGGTSGSNHGACDGEGSGTGSGGGSRVAPAAIRRPPPPAPRHRWPQRSLAAQRRPFHTFSRIFAGRFLRLPRVWPVAEGGNREQTVGSSSTSLFSYCLLSFIHAPAAISFGAEIEISSR